MTTMQARKQFFLDNYPKGHKAMIAVMKVINCNDGEGRKFK